MEIIQTRNLSFFQSEQHNSLWNWAVIFEHANQIRSVFTNLLESGKLGSIDLLKQLKEGKITPQKNERMQIGIQVRYVVH